MDDETNPQFKPGALKEVFKLEQHRNTRGRVVGASKRVFAADDRS